MHAQRIKQASRIAIVAILAIDDATPAETTTTLTRPRTT